MPKGTTTKFKKNYRKKKQVKLSAPMKKAIKAVVDKEIAPEIKYRSGAITNASLFKVETGTNATANQMQLTRIPQGVQDSQRIGDSIKLKGIQVKLRFFTDPTLATAYKGDVVRVLIYQYHDNNAASASVFDLGLILSGSNNMSGQVDANSYFNIDNQKANMFTVLYDKTMTIRPQYGYTVSEGMYIKVPLKYARKLIQFQAGQDYGNDLIYCAVLGSKQNTGTDFTYYAASYRCYYTDA